MKRTIYIESIKKYNDNDGCYHYVPVSHNRELIVYLLTLNEITCEKVYQTSEKYWQLDIKGRKNNVRNFINDLMLMASDIYTIREY